MQRFSLQHVVTALAASLVLSSAATAQLAEDVTLTFSQRGGEGSIEIRNENGRPGDIYFTAMSLIQANGYLPGSGWWYGLHISAAQLVDQAVLGAPFAGFLDENGESYFAMPAGTLHPAVPTIYAVTTCFRPDFFALTGVSNLTSILQMPAPIIVDGPMVSAEPVVDPMVPMIDVVTDVPTQVELIIDDGEGPPAVVMASPDFKTEHLGVPVLGMRPNTTVSVSVVVRNINGTPTQASYDLTFAIAPVPVPEN